MLKLPPQPTKAELTVLWACLTVGICFMVICFAMACVKADVEQDAHIPYQTCLITGCKQEYSL